MTHLSIRQARPEDLPRIMQIYAHARAFMAAHGNPRQWGATNWPPEELITDDIRNGHCYVCEGDGSTVGVFYYDFGEDIDPSYRHTENGTWLGNSTYGVVHRIASDGSCHGVGSFCIDWAFDQCGHLRMDTHPDNVVMQNLLAKLGFVRCGTVHVPEDDDLRLAYEKLAED